MEKFIISNFNLSNQMFILPLRWRWVGAVPDVLCFGDWTSAMDEWRWRSQREHCATSTNDTVDFRVPGSDCPDVILVVNELLRKT